MCSNSTLGPVQDKAIVHGVDLSAVVTAKAFIVNNTGRY